MPAQKIPEPVALDTNIDGDGNMYVIVKDHGYQVISWSPGKAGEGVPSTQVHLLLQLPIHGAKAVLRLKSARALDELIGVLLNHRKVVWPDQGRKG